MPDWIDSDREELGELLELLEMEVSLSSEEEEVGHSTFQSAYRTRLFAQGLLDNPSSSDRLISPL